MSYATNFVGSFSVLFAPLAMLILMFVDYFKGYVDDLFRRRMFVMMIVPTFFAIVSDLVYDVFAGMPGVAAYYAIYIASFFYYFFQVMAYYASCLFVDYQMNKSRVRTMKLVRIIGGIILLHLAVLLLNIPFGFYFQIGPDNLFVPGKLYVVRMAFAYSAFLVTVVNMVCSRKNLLKDQIVLILFFFVLVAIGSSLDLLFTGMKLVWPCMCTGMLFLYFFIIQAESLTDALTGVNNRKSCEEYMRNIAEASKRQDFHFIMIDLDHFKQINDMYGHVQGDQALRDAANLIRNCFRKNDFVGRYGGDEFLVISAADNVKMLVERLEQEFSRFNNEDGRVYKLRISVGFDRYVASSRMKPNEFVAQVDAAMYAAKRNKEERRKELAQS